MRRAANGLSTVTTRSSANGNILCRYVRGMRASSARDFPRPIVAQPFEDKT
ncbi:MAG: hypothetical protein U1D30_12905 [Planctomycetota bacterium]